jgi:hypothetical protein
MQSPVFFRPPSSSWSCQEQYPHFCLAAKWIVLLCQMIFVLTILYRINHPCCHDLEIYSFTKSLAHQEYSSYAVYFWHMRPHGSIQFTQLAPSSFSRGVSCMSGRYMLQFYQVHNIGLMFLTLFSCPIELL